MEKEGGAFSLFFFKTFLNVFTKNIFFILKSKKKEQFTFST